MIPQWLRNEISDGLSGLMALRLRNAPGEDTVDMTADIWEQAMVRHLGRYAEESLDATRIREGFRRIFSVVREWPAPREVIEQMPKRPPLPSLPPPSPGASVDQEYRECKPLLDKIVERCSMPPVETEAERRRKLRAQIQEGKQAVPHGAHYGIMADPEATSDARTLLPPDGQEYLHEGVDEV